MARESTQVQGSQVAALELASLETLLFHLMSPSNDQRSRAETLYSFWKQTNPDTLSLNLAQLPHSSPHEQARAMSAILLRLHLTRHHSDSNSLWPRLNHLTQSSLKSLLLSSVESESSKSVKKKLCDTVSELASAILPDDGWPELFPFIFKGLSSFHSPEFQESAFLIFALLLQHMQGWLDPRRLMDIINRFSRLQQLHAIFRRCLTSTKVSSGVQIAALYVVISFFKRYFSCEPGFRLFPEGNLLLMMMGVLTRVLASGKEEFFAREVLELLLDFAESKGWMFHWDRAMVIEVMLNFAENESLEDGTRCLAIELVMALLGTKEFPRHMVRAGQKVFVADMKLRQLVCRLFAILMKMLLNIEDDPAWHSSRTEDEDELVGETIIYSVALESLGNLAVSFGGDTDLRITRVLTHYGSGETTVQYESDNFLDRLAIHFAEETFFHVAYEQLSAYLAAPEWRKRHAALIALAQITAGCSQVMMKYLEDVVAMVLNPLSDDHPRVRWAAINAIGRLATGLGPDAQLLYLQHKVLPALDAASEDFQNPRLKSRAASAKLSLSENCETPLYKPYWPIIYPKVLEMQETGRQKDLIPLDRFANLVLGEW